MEIFGLGTMRLALIPDYAGQISGDAVFHPATRREWGQGLPVNEEGNVAMVVASLLITDGEEYTLVDTGFIEAQEPSRPQTILTGLAALGLQPKQIRRVILTHAHGDHLMGNTLERDGRYIPTFPLAEYIVQEREIAASRKAEDELWRTKLAPLAARGQLHSIDGTTAVADGITCWLTPGHTIGHQSVLIKSQDQQALFVGDLAIFAQNFQYPEWGPGWAWSRELDRDSRQQVADWAVEQNAVLIVGHDPRHPWIRLRRAGNGYRSLAANPS